MDMYACFDVKRVDDIAPRYVVEVRVTPCHISAYPRLALSNSSVIQYLRPTAFNIEVVYEKALWWKPWELYSRFRSWLSPVWEL